MSRYRRIRIPREWSIAENRSHDPGEDLRSRGEAKAEFGTGRPCQVTRSEERDEKQDEPAQEDTLP